MKIKRLTAPLAIVAVAALSLTACASNESSSPATATATTSSLSGTLNGIGSSAQGVAQTTWISGFQQNNPNVTVNYNPQGSGAGQQSFIAGSADFAGSDAALSAAQLSSTFAGCAAGSKAIDLPVYISPIAIAYNLNGVKDLKLDANTIAGIFSGKITTWNDSAIASQNPGVTLPSTAITVVHRSDNSGTTFNFTDYLHAVAPSAWPQAASQTFPYQVGDAAKGTSGVATDIKNNQNTIGYIDESATAGMSIAQLKVGKNYVKISAQGAADVVANSPLASGRPTHDLAIALNRNDSSSGAWPLVLVSYLIVCQNYKTSTTADLVKAYVDYVVSSAAQKAANEQAGSAPLASSLAAKVVASVSTIK